MSIFFENECYGLALVQSAKPPGTALGYELNLGSCHSLTAAGHVMYTGSKKDTQLGCNGTQNSRFSMYLGFGVTVR